MARSRTHYNVAPRYSPGSPAQVDFETASGVVDDERHGHKAALEGAYGPERKAQAEQDGLDGIVEERIEKADCWVIIDMITGRQFVRMFPAHESIKKRLARAFRLRAKYRLEVEESQ